MSNLTITLIIFGSMGFMEFMLFLSTLSYKEYIVETKVEEVVKVATFPVSTINLSPKHSSNESVMSYARYTPNSLISEHKLLTSDDYEIEVLTYNAKDYIHIKKKE